MKRRRYLIDENITPALAGQLLRRKPEMEVLTVGGRKAPPKGTLDPEILRWIEENEFSLVTGNRKSMPGHLKDHLLQGRHVPGIFTLRPNVLIGEVIDDLFLVWEAANPNEYRDQIVFIPLL